ncbi:hypothetical protein Tco_0707750 [Tanacetum coccineum]
MAEIGCNWARIGPSKSSQSLSIAHKWAVETTVFRDILLVVRPIRWVQIASNSSLQSGSGLTAESSSIEL